MTASVNGNKVIKYINHLVTINSTIFISIKFLKLFYANGDCLDRLKPYYTS